MSATSGKDAPKHGSVGPVCDSSLKDGQAFSNLLKAHMKQLDISIGTASVITWAFADTAGLRTQDRVAYIWSFMNASFLILLAAQATITFPFP